MTYNRILTCGTFDLFHIGHVNMLKRSKEMGKFLVVGISSDKCNKEKNKKAIINEKDRFEIIKSCKYVDEVFIEESLDEKETYVKKYEIDLFIIGDDWQGKFDNLSCDVLYLPRTENISTSLIKKENFPDIWFLKYYEQFLHKPIDFFLTHQFNLLIINLNKYQFIFWILNPNMITLFSLLTFFPIYYSNNNYLTSVLFLCHDFLDRCDGSLARAYFKQNIDRNEKYGAYLDAICDKIFVFLVGSFIIHDNLLYFKMFIHFLSCIKRTQIYFYIENSKNKSTMAGKMGTFIENISFSLYFIYPDLYSFMMMFSIVLTLQSLYEKFR